MGDNDVLSSLVAGMVQADLLDHPERRAGRPHRRSAQARGRAPDPADHRPRGRNARPGRRKRRTARQRRDGHQAQGGAAGGPRGYLRDYRPGPRRRCPRRCARSGARNRHAGAAGATRLTGRKHWIAFALRPSGTLALDRGAAEALRSKGRSLLPSGIREVRGDFASGDCVSLLDSEGIEFGRGLVNYPAADVLKVKGRARRRFRACSATRLPTKSFIATISC